MKKMKRSPIKIVASVLALVFLVSAVMACGKSTNTTTSSTAYQLTHSPEDTEYILNWDLIVSQCPEIGGYNKQDVFVRRGESKQLSTGETFTIEMNLPVAWSSVRFVRTEPVGENFRSFGVYLMYCDTAEGLDEYLEMDDIKYGMLQGVPIKYEGEFGAAIIETETPLKTIQFLLAGKQFVIMLMEYASPDESLFFSKDELSGLLTSAKTNINALEITPLSTDIPERIKNIESSGTLHRVILTVHSGELPLPVPFPEEQAYNTLWFENRPLMQSVSFSVDGDWQYVINATGAINTKFEVLISVTQPGDPAVGYSSVDRFLLDSVNNFYTNTQTLGEVFRPPVDVEMTVLFDLPTNWIITISEG